MSRASKALLVSSISAALAGGSGCLSTPPSSGPPDSSPSDPRTPDAEPPDGEPDVPLPDPACPHQGRDVCVPGACIDEAAGGCVATVCDTMPSCCDTAWSSTCTAIASTTCAACGHAPQIGAHQHTYVVERVGASWVVKWLLDQITDGSRAEYLYMAWADRDNDGDADLALAGACEAGVFPTVSASASSSAVAMGPPTWLDLDDGVEGCPDPFLDQFRGEAVAWGDVDRDGLPDVAVGGAHGLMVFRQTDGGWAAETVLAQTDFPVDPDAGVAEPERHEVRYVTWLDLDGDRWLDLVAAKGSGLVTFRNLAGVLQPSDGWMGPRSVERATTCNLDGDGVELLIAVTSDRRLSAFRPAGTALALDLQVDANALAVACGDLDGDGLPELISTDEIYDPPPPAPTTPGRVRVWRRASLALPFEQVWESTGTHRNSGTLAIGDDDGDGDLDLLFADPGDGPAFAGDWFHLLENVTASGQGIQLVDHSGQYLPPAPGIYSYGAAWMPLGSAR